MKGAFEIDAVTGFFVGPSSDDMAGWLWAPACGLWEERLVSEGRDWNVDRASSVLENRALHLDPSTTQANPPGGQTPRAAP